MRIGRARERAREKEGLVGRRSSPDPTSNQLATPFLQRVQLRLDVCLFDRHGPVALLDGHFEPEGDFASFDPCAQQLLHVGAELVQEPGRRLLALGVGLDAEEQRLVLGSHFSQVRELGA